MKNEWIDARIRQPEHECEVLCLGNMLNAKNPVVQDIFTAIFLQKEKRWIKADFLLEDRSCAVSDWIEPPEKPEYYMGRGTKWNPSEGQRYYPMEMA